MLVLASRSPQRRAILDQLGIAFDVVVPEVEEVEDGDPYEVARRNAERKVAAVVASTGGPSLRGPEGETPILAVDTVVTLDGELYGKPRDEAHARAMLTALSGREHLVIGGLALRRDGETRVVDATTRVRFRDAIALLDWYLASEEWRDRAGGYAIQGRGAALVERIDGDYFNVVGLPVAALLELWPGVLQISR